MVRLPKTVKSEPEETPLAAGNLRIVSDGTPFGTRVEHWDGDKYEPLEYVTKIEWVASIKGGVNCVIHLRKVPVNVIARSYSEVTSDDQD